MEKIISEIIKKYKNNNVFPDDLGLISGKTGIGVAYFILSNYAKDQTLSDKGFDVFDAITENIANINEINFANGLAGIGWAIEWLAQNDFFEVNTDEILEDVDNAIYKAIMFAPDKNLSLSNGTLGKLLYLFKRKQGVNADINRFKTISHETCLIILTDELRDKLMGENGLLKNIEENLIVVDFKLLGHLIVFLSDFLNCKINEPTVETILYETIKIVSEILAVDIGAIKRDDIEDLKFLAICYFIAGKNHAHNYWQEQANKHVQLLVNSTKDLILTHKDLSISGFKIYLLINRYLPQIVNRQDIETLLIDIVNQGSINVFNNPGNLLALLDLKNEKPISKIDELSIVFY